MEIKYSNEDLVNMLEERGYKIDIETVNDSKYVSFNHRHAKHPHQLLHSYSTEWSDHHIKKDVVDILLRWSGLKVKITLDY